MEKCKDTFCKRLVKSNTTCENYVPINESEFRTWSISPDKELIFNKMDNNMILFGIKGHIEIHCPDKEKITLLPRQMILIAQSSFLRISSQMRGTLFIFQFTEIDGFCHNSYPQLYNGITIKYEFHPTHIHHILVSFLNSCASLFNCNMLCKKISEIKKQEFFYYLSLLYTPGQIAYFLHPILNKEISFRKKVLKYIPHSATATQLAEYFGYSRSVFYKKFYDEFQMTVKEWIVKQKIEQIRLLAMKPGISVKEMMILCGYSSGGHFSHFFRKNLHCTPKEYLERVITKK